MLRNIFHVFYGNSSRILVFCGLLYSCGMPYYSQAQAMSWVELQQELAQQIAMPIDDLVLSKASQRIVEEIKKSENLSLIHYNFSHKKDHIIAKINDGNKRKFYVTFDILGEERFNAEHNFRKHKNANKDANNDFLIKKGQKIDVIYKKGNLTIETEGVALSAAEAVGSRMEVKLQHSNKTISVVANDKNSAYVAE